MHCRDKLGGRFRYFLFFSAREGEGGVRGARRGVGSVFGGGGLQEEEGPGGCLRRIGDFSLGGAKYFFSGPKRPPSKWINKGGWQKSGILVNLKVFL